MLSLTFGLKKTVLVRTTMYHTVIYCDPNVLHRNRITSTSNTGTNCCSLPNLKVNYIIHLIAKVKNKVMRNPLSRTSSIFLTYWFFFRHRFIFSLHFTSKFCLWCCQSLTCPAPFRSQSLHMMKCD